VNNDSLDELIGESLRKAEQLALDGDHVASDNERAFAYEMRLIKEGRTP
jgi:hypothetical protein